MGQKVNPRSLRTPLIEDYESNWYVRNKAQFAQNIREDNAIRQYFRKQYRHAAVSRILIERKSEKLLIKILTGKTGVLVGRGGQGLERIRKELTRLTGRATVQLEVLELAKVDMDAQLIADSIAIQLEKRVAYRRALRLAVQRAQKAGVEGIKIMVSGRLGGAEIARTEWTKEGRVPLHTFRAQIDYALSEAKTVFGIIGIKTWVFHGEVMPNQLPASNIKQKSSAERGAGAEGGGGVMSGEASGGRSRRGAGGSSPHGPSGRSSAGRRPPNNQR